MGVALCGAYFVFERTLPRGAAEFVFWPPLEPLPFAPMRGFTYEQLARHVGRLLILGPGLLALGFGIARWAPPRLQLRRVTLVAAGLSLVASAYLMASVLGDRAIFDDELTYRFQAQLLGEGRLGEATVPPWGAELFTIWTPHGATGKYLFGEPLIQLPGRWVGLHALPHLLLLGLSLLLWYRQIEAERGADEALWATLLLAVSPMLILTTATGLSQPTSLACLVGAGYGYRLLAGGWGESGSGGGRAAWWGALWVGGCLGFGLSVRPQVMVPAGAVLGLASLVSLVRRRHFGPILLLAASGGALVGCILLYNRALTGSPWSLPWSLFEPAERYGFGRPLQGDPFVHDGVTLIENLLVVALRLNGWWLGWPLSLGLLAAWLVWVRRLDGLRLWLGVGAAILLFHLPYYSTGVSETGPVYFYELLLPLSLLGAQAVVRLFELRPRLATALLLVHLTLGSGWFVAEKVARLDRMVRVIHGPVEAAMEGIETPALLIYEPALQESIRLGWLNSGFPKRERAESAPIVIYPRGRPRTVPLLRQRYGYRHCYYYRVHPQEIRPQLLRCEEAEDLLARPNELPGPALAIQSTAMRRGLLDPFARKTEGEQP